MDARHKAGHDAMERVMHDIRFIRENPDAFDRGLARRGLAAAGAAADCARRERGARHPKSSKPRRRAAMRRRRKSARPRKEQRRSQRQRPDGRGRGAEGFHPADGGGGETASKALNDALAEIPNLPLDEVPDGKDEKGQRRASSLRGEARLCVRAEAAFRARRSARPDGFRDGGEAVRRALCRFEERSWRGSNARSGNFFSMCIRASRTVTPKSRRRFSCVTKSCSARRNCQNLRKINSCVDNRGDMA